MNDSVESEYITYTIPLIAVRYAPELEYSEENMSQWFTISEKVPELYSSDLTKLLKLLEVAGSIVLAPMLVDYCKNYYGIQSGPVEFCESMYELENFTPHNNLFESIFKPKYYKFAQFWSGMNLAMQKFVHNTLLINPTLLLTDIEQPGLLGFKKWFRKIMDIYEQILDYRI